MATRVTDPRSLQAILAMSGDSGANTELKSILEGLTVGEVAVLPGFKAGEKMGLYKLLPRLAPHVRHRVKYFDVSVSEGQGFVFTRKGKAVGTTARTLREFVSALACLPPGVLDGHAHRGDFSRWIGDVFRDHPLSSRVRKVEEQHRLGHIHDLGHALATLIQERYDLSPSVNVPG